MDSRPSRATWAADTVATVRARRVAREGAIAASLHPAPLVVQVPAMAVLRAELHHIDRRACVLTTYNVCMIALAQAWRRFVEGYCGSPHLCCESAGRLEMTPLERREGSGSGK